MVDHQVILSALPEADTKGEIIDDRYQVGGPVPTALTLLQRLGCETTFQGKWCNDPFGQTIEQDLRGESIEFDERRCRSATRSGFAHVWVEEKTGRRSIAAYRGSHPVEPHDLTPNQLDGFDALHLDGWSTPAAIALAGQMKAQGGTVTLDLGSPKPQLEQLLADVDVVNCPERLVHRLFAIDDLQQGAKRILEMGPREITMTRGENGAIHFTRDRMIEHPGYTIHAVDTNGAGDVFAGAMVYGILRGWTADHRLEFACAAAAFKCTKLGNRRALPSLEQIDTFCRTARLAS